MVRTVWTEGKYWNGEAGGGGGNKERGKEGEIKGYCKYTRKEGKSEGGDVDL